MLKIITIVAFVLIFVWFLSGCCSLSDDYCIGFLSGVSMSYEETLLIQFVL